MKPSHVAISYTNSVPQDVFTGFIQIVSTDNLDLRVESREQGGPFAAIEWLIPTAVIVYISKSYFDSFLKEMGKDHYSLLKTGLRTLHGKLVGPSVPKVDLISSAGKVLSEQQYSLRYSILADASGGVRFKLLIQPNVSLEEYDEILASFLTFLEAYHSGTLDPRSLEIIEGTRVVGRMLLLMFNFDSRAIEPVDPIPNRPKDQAPREDRPNQ